LKNPKTKQGFKQIEIENGTILWEGCWGDDRINFSVAFVKLDKGVGHASFQPHTHPGNCVIGVLSGELRIVELDKTIGPDEVVHISKKKGEGFRHSIEIFEDTKMFVVTWNPPDPDIPMNGKNKSSINSMLVANFLAPFL